MPSLKETKGRIGSVKSTLKITSAMKLVASAKLRKAQKATEALRPYEATLIGILDSLGSGFESQFARHQESPRSVVVIAMASNSSICGGFNASAVRETLAVIDGALAVDPEKTSIEVISIGRKMADAMRKVGYPSVGEWHHLSEHPDYETAAEIVEGLMERFRKGEIDRVVMVYNHFVSTASQKPVREELLPIAGFSSVNSDEGSVETEYIIEPSPAEVYAELLPKTLRLKLYAALLDSAAAEHAARTVAMQTATDNGEDLLEELTLEYNKGRQQKITSEILDIIGGSMQK